MIEGLWIDCLMYPQSFKRDEAIYIPAEGVYAVNPFVSYWWLLVFPCGVLFVTLLALNFLGDGLRDALDPKAVG